MSIANSLETLFPNQFRTLMFACAVGTNWPCRHLYQIPSFFCLVVYASPAALALFLSLHSHFSLLTGLFLVVLDDFFYWRLTPTLTFYIYVFNFINFFIFTVINRGIHNKPKFSTPPIRRANRSTPCFFRLFPTIIIRLFRLYNSSWNKFFFTVTGKIISLCFTIIFLCSLPSYSFNNVINVFIIPTIFYFLSQGNFTLFNTF